MKPRSREQSSEGEGETEKEKRKKNQRWRQDLREQRTLQMSWGSRGVLRAWGRELESWDELSEVRPWEWGKEAESFERGVRLWECLGVRTFGLDFRFLPKWRSFRLGKSQKNPNWSIIGSTISVPDCLVEPIGFLIFLVFKLFSVSTHNQTGLKAGS